MLRNIYPSLWWGLEETTTARMLVLHRHPIHTGILNLTTLSPKGHTLKYHFLTWVYCGKRLVIDTFSKYKVVSKLVIKEPLHCYEILSFQSDLTLVNNMSYLFSTHRWKQQCTYNQGLCILALSLHGIFLTWSVRCYQESQLNEADRILLLLFKK